MQHDPVDTSFLADPMPPLKMFFSLRGRIGRQQFWWYGVCVLLGLDLLGHALLEVAGFDPDLVDRTVNLLLLWPAVAVSVKRWHDRDKSGWWVLLNLVPVVGQMWALVDNGFLRGTDGANPFGMPSAG